MCSNAYISKNSSIEELLELLIAVVDAELLKTVHFIVFCKKKEGGETKEEEP